MNRTGLVLWFGLACMALAQNAYAYIDPGAGALLLQLLMATVLGGFFYLRKIFVRLISFFGRRDKSERAK